MSNAPTPTVEPRRTWLYLRISRDEAGDELGVARQERALRDLVKRQGWRVAGVFCDNDLSAYRGRHRPGYQQLLASVGPGDAIAVSEITRLTRHPRELEDLVEFVEARRVDIVALRAGQIDLATSGGRAFARLLGTFARMESEQIGERVSAKHRELASAGRPNGGRAHYGYRRVGKSLEVDAEHAAVVREMVAAALAGLPVRRIVVDLNERGVPSPTGRLWSTAGVSKILRSPTIAGLRVAHGEIVGPAGWEPIIDRATHERLVGVLTHAPVGRRVRSNMLAGFMRCGVCGAAMKGRRAGASAGNRRYYACDRTVGCGSNAVGADNVERVVVELVLGTAMTVDLTAARARRSGVDASALAGDLAADERLLVDLAADVGERRISRAEFLAARGPVERRIAETRARLAAIDDRSAALDGVDVLTPESWEGLSFDQRRGVLAVFVDRVTVAKGQRGRRFDGGRVTVDWKV